MDPLPEHETARGLREGSAEAWRAFYDAHAERLWFWVARQVGPQTADVADVVQETFLAAARSASGFDPDRGTLWSWLIGIGRNHVALHYRKLQRRQRLQPAGANGETLAWLESGEPAPASLVATAEMGAIIRATLAELQSDYGTLLTARYLDDTSVEDLAAAEQCTTTARALQVGAPAARFARRSRRW